MLPASGGQDISYHVMTALVDFSPIVTGGRVFHVPLPSGSGISNPLYIRVARPFVPYRYLVPCMRFDAKYAGSGARIITSMPDDLPRRSIALCQVASPSAFRLTAFIPPTESVLRFGSRGAIAAAPPDDSQRELDAGLGFGAMQIDPNFALHHPSSSAPRSAASIPPRGSVSPSRAERVGPPEGSSIMLRIIYAAMGRDRNTREMERIYVRSIPVVVMYIGEGAIRRPAYIFRLRDGADFEITPNTIHYHCHGGCMGSKAVPAGSLDQQPRRPQQETEVSCAYLEGVLTDFTKFTLIIPLDVSAEYMAMHTPSAGSKPSMDDAPNAFYIIDAYPEPHPDQNLGEDTRMTIIAPTYLPATV